ncbi:MAG TPA: hypothetical protein VGM25_01275 [Caulobacteraceae bacterium]|jgi:hypothetical protein
MADETTPLATTTPTDACVDGEACARTLVERQLEALEELVRIGLKIAQAIERQVDAAEARPQAGGEAAAGGMAYARVARAVRQSILLQSRLTGQTQAEAAAEAAVHTRERAVKARLGDIVQDVIEAEHDDPEAVERLGAEAVERLDRDLYGDVLERPVREIIADICKDLGLHPTWPRLFGEMAAIQEIAQGGEDRPYAGPMKVVWLDANGPDPPQPVRDSS